MISGFQELINHSNINIDYYYNMKVENLDHLLRMRQKSIAWLQELPMEKNIYKKRKEIGRAEILFL